MKHSELIKALEYRGFISSKLPDFSNKERVAFMSRDLELGHAQVVCKYRDRDAYYIGVVGGGDAITAEDNNRRFRESEQEYSAEDVLLEADKNPP